MSYVQQDIIEEEAVLHLLRNGSADGSVCTMRRRRNDSSPDRVWRCPPLLEQKEERQP